MLSIRMQTMEPACDENARLIISNDNRLCSTSKQVNLAVNTKIKNAPKADNQRRRDNRKYTLHLKNLKSLSH